MHFCASKLIKSVHSVFTCVTEIEMFAISLKFLKMTSKGRFYSLGYAVKSCGVVL